MTELVTITRRGTSLEVLFNRPAKKNALTHEMYAAMADALDQAEHDLTITSILFHGEGTAFTAGNDLQDFVTNPPQEDGPTLAFLRALATTDVPLIVAAHGPAVGIGATMMLHCDIVLAAPSTALRFPFVNLALVPEAASSLLLPRAVGYLRAAEILLLGEPIDAIQAQQLGLVSRVTAEGEELTAAREVADAIAAKAPQAVRATKRLLKDDTPGLVARVDSEVRIFRDRLTSAEFGEAVTAFLEKREPNFQRLLQPATTS